jgi:hypothetical protein
MVIFTVIAVANFNFITNTHNFGICLSDLAVMAHANEEQTLPNECGDAEHSRCYKYENKYACQHDPEVQDPPVNCND